MVNKNFKAVLFDFDGVLADTMEDNFKAWKNVFELFNVEIKREDYFPLEGMKMVKIVETIGDKYGKKFSEAECLKIKKLKDRYYLENHNFIFYRGVLGLVERLNEKGTLLAIVSASPKEKLEKTVPRDFLEKFNVVVSGDDTVNGKPNPEPYLTAVKKLGLNVGECVVVENAPLGIMSAKNADIYCIAMSTTLEEGYLIEADKIVGNHEELERELLIDSVKGFSSDFV